MRLAYIEEEVQAQPCWYLAMPTLQKVMFFKDYVYINSDGKNPPYYFYGTLTKSLGAEFQGCQGWDINKERRLFYALSNLGVVKSIATMFPTAEDIRY